MRLHLEISSFHKYTSEVKSELDVDSGERSRVTLGRSNTCDWVLPDPERVISNIHAEIFEFCGSYFIKDVSTNGLFINNDVNPIGSGNEATLKHGDLLNIGEYEIQVSLIDVQENLIENNPTTPPKPKAQFEPQEFVEPAFERASMTDFESPEVKPEVEKARTNTINNDVVDHIEDPLSHVGLHDTTESPVARQVEQKLDIDQPSELAKAPINESRGLESERVAAINVIETPKGVDTPIQDPAQTEIGSDLVKQTAVKQATVQQDKHTQGFTHADEHQPEQSQPVSQTLTTPEFSTQSQPHAAYLQDNSAVEQAHSPEKAIESESNVEPHYQGEQPYQSEAQYHQGAVETSISHSQHDLNLSQQLAPTQREEFESKPEAVQPRAIHPNATQQVLATEQPLSQQHHSQHASQQSLAAAFEKGLGITIPKELIRDEHEYYENLGRCFGLMIDGLITNQRNRSEFKQNNRLSHTTFTTNKNNPLKFSADIEDALYNLFLRRSSSFLSPEESIKESFDDLAIHEKALMQGVHGTVEGILDLLSPEKIVEEANHSSSKSLFSSSGTRAWWNEFKTTHENLEEESESGDFPVYLQDFATSYDKYLKGNK